MNNKINYKNIFYPETRFGGFSKVDGTIAFYTRINALINKRSTVLNIGCGRGAFKEETVPFRRDMQIFKGRVKKVIGIDVDERAQANPYLDDFKLIKDGRFPLKSGSVDLCYCDYVLEHIENPKKFIRECKRVLKKGGYLCFRTTNSWGYISIYSRLIPQKLHSRVINKVQDGRKSEDIFKKYYRMNSILKLQKMLRRARFDACIYGYSSEPAYSSFSKMAYFLTLIWHRLTPSLFKETILGFAQKK